MSAPLLSHFPGRRVLIVGDVMLDAFVWGSVRRISPEAPVPVVEVERHSHAPGGAANTAANVAGLRGEALLLGVVGDDEAGRHLRQTLTERGVRTDGLLVTADRPTTSKTRILAHNQQVVRLDREQRGPLPPEVEERLATLAEGLLPDVEVCVLSDYAKGVLSPTLTQRLLQRARALGKPVLVDPKGSDFGRFAGATLLKPNLHEASLFLGRAVATAADVVEAGRGLLRALHPRAVLLTRGAEGMTLFEQDAEPVHVPALAREVYDVTGAGDTVAATLAVALAAGASLLEAAHLASRAAAIVVGRVGTAAVRWDDLVEDPTLPRNRALR